GRTDTGHAIHTQVSNVPHMSITGINYDADGKQTFETLTFHRSGNKPTFNDPHCYFHTSGVFQASFTETRLTLSGNSPTGVDLDQHIGDTLGEHVITHTCTVDGKSNTLVETIYTTARDNPVINIRPGAEAIHPLGDPFTPLSICTSTFDANLPLGGPTITDGAMMPVSVTAIDESTPLGTYVLTYSCSQVIPANDNHLGGTLNAASRTLTLTVADGEGPDLRVPSGRVIHEQGAAFDVNDHATCTDGSGTMDISIDPVIDASTAADTYETIISCTDGTNTRTAPLTVVVRAPGMPVITLYGEDPVYAEQHFFRDPGAACADPEDGLLPVTSAITGPDGRVVDPAEARDMDRGRYLVTYSCTDSAGAEASPANRTVYVGRVGDDLPPVITITGYSVTYHALGTPYADRGATCHDDNYGDLPARTTRNDVNYNRAGAYTVAYECSDMRHTASAERIVRVVSEAPALGTPVVSFPPGVEDVVSGAAASAPPPGIIDRHGNATRLPAPDPGGAAAHEAGILHPQGAEFVPPAASCVYGSDPDGNRIIAAANLTHSITSSTPAGAADVTYSCSDRPNPDVTRVLHVMITADTETSPPRLVGPSTVTLRPGAQYDERGAACADQFTLPGRQLLPVVSGDDVLPEPGTYRLLYVCIDAAGTSSPVGRTIIVRAAGGDDEDWHLSPTFGRSWLGGGQQVRGGFAFDGRAIDITDNFHTGLDRRIAQVGGESTITMKAYSEMDLERFTIYLGVPDVSRATDSDAAIHVDLRRDYMAPAGYAVAGISHDQSMPLIRENSTTASVSAAGCGAGDEMCTTVEVSFSVAAPLSSDIVAIAAMDTERRFTVSYVNDGVRFDGTSMLPAETASFVIKRGNQHPAEWVHLVREDWRYNLWEDQHGFAWVRNSYGSWEQVTRAGFERLADPEVSVMTRNHDRFADMLERERDRAALVFNATTLEREVGGSFSHDAPVRVERLKDPAILERLKIEELAALEYLAGPR
ncbi:MAG: DUF5011 domain-containing protein, partial [Nitrosopumilus sp.]|nr:DUF5011 domain-containing protein [Nitrosopumilus sp.]